MNFIYKCYKIVLDFTDEMNDNHVSAYASSAAFFIFISLIPCAMLLLAIIPYTPIQKSDLFRVMIGILPESVDGLALNIIDELYGKSMALISVTAIAMIWSAAKGVLAITMGLNAVYNVNETRNYIILRIRAAIYTLGIIIAVVVCLVVMIFSNRISNLLIREMPHLATFSGLLSKFRLLLTPLVLTFVFTLLYKYIPNRRASFLSQIPGAAFSGVVWSVFSFGFSVYVDYFNGFSMYGSMTTIIIVMLWLYICMTIIFLGAQINAYFEPVFQYIRAQRRHRKNNKKRKV